jgi:tetratricopeptide (TPR) repeat protein
VRRILAFSLVCICGCSSTKPDSSVQKGQATADDPARVEIGAIKTSVLTGIAQDSQPLFDLAQKSGWGLYFRGQLMAAIDAFQPRIKSDADARIGAARAALGLARGYGQLDTLQKAILPELMKAQASRPNAASIAPWHAYIRFRLAGVQSSAKADFEKAMKAGGLGVLVPVSEQGGNTLSEALNTLAEKSAPGLGTAVTETYRSRLSIRTRLKLGQKRLAKRWRRLKIEQPDLVVGEGTGAFELWDAALGDIGRLYFAGLALEFLGNGQGCSTLYQGEAFFLLGDYQKAEAAFRAAGQIELKSLPLACALLSQAVTMAEYRQVAEAGRAVAMARAGQIDEARIIAKGLANQTLAQKVRNASVTVELGEKLDPAFEPKIDRLVKIITTHLQGLGAAAKGTSDVAELSLVERYVDSIQRKWADTLSKADQRVEAARARTAAGDKTKAYEVSARNSFESLAASALDHFKIGQPRVALKYLTKLTKQQPMASALAEQLRDVLSYQALTGKGGVTAGQ